MKTRVIFYLLTLSLLYLSACHKEQELPSTFEIKSARYYWNSLSPIDTIDFTLSIEKQGDTINNYIYFKEDNFTKQRRILIDLEVKHDSVFLMKVGDYSLNVSRVINERKTFYVGSMKVEVFKLKRKEGGDNDVIFFTKEFGIVNMQSYDRHAKVLYRIVSDKFSANILNEINAFLEKDKTGFYYPSQLKE